jgi:hypothetical protein
MYSSRARQSAATGRASAPERRAAATTTNKHTKRAAAPPPNARPLRENRLRPCPADDQSRARSRTCSTKALRPRQTCANDTGNDCQANNANVMDPSIGSQEKIEGETPLQPFKNYESHDFLEGTGQLGKRTVGEHRAQWIAAR